MQESPTGVHIERNQKGFFYIADDENYYTNYWMQLLDSDGTILGVIGMQVKMEDYNQLIPEAVIEEPYTLSLIMLYNKNLERMWQMECRGSDCDKQDINQAADFIDQAIKQQSGDQAGQYLQWEQSQEISLGEVDQESYSMLTNEEKEEMDKNYIMRI